MSEPPVLTIHTDGASRGNPGDAAFAYVIARGGEPPIEEAGCLGQMTNNQAEYTALVRALEHALRLGPEHRLVIKSDSELMVKQMRGEYKVKNEDLRELYDRARQLARRFAGVTFQHVRREQNKRTDQLCNEALDGVRDSAAAPLRIGGKEELLACLELADAQPSAAVVWGRLVAILQKHGVTIPPGLR
jgi:ribonuclease HI